MRQIHLTLAFILLSSAPAITSTMIASLVLAFAFIAAGPTFMLELLTGEMLFELGVVTLYSVYSVLVLFLLSTYRPRALQATQVYFVLSLVWAIDQAFTPVVSVSELRASGIPVPAYSNQVWIGVMLVYAGLCAWFLKVFSNPAVKHEYRVVSRENRRLFAHLYGHSLDTP